MSVELILLLVVVSSSVLVGVGLIAYDHFAPILTAGRGAVIAERAETEIEELRDQMLDEIDKAVRRAQHGEQWGWDR